MSSHVALEVFERDFSAMEVPEDPYFPYDRNGLMPHDLGRPFRERLRLQRLRTERDVLLRIVRGMIEMLCERSA